MAVYDRIGTTYAKTRRPDPRIDAAIRRALGGAQSVVNVGAGSGSYEPPETVLAVEPSAVMIAQRREGLAPAVQATADASRSRTGRRRRPGRPHGPSLAEPGAGVLEMRRVARGSSSSPGIPAWHALLALARVPAGRGGRVGHRPLPAARVGAAADRPRRGRHARPGAARLHRRLLRRLLAAARGIPRSRRPGGRSRTSRISATPWPPRSSVWRPTLVGRVAPPSRRSARVGRARSGLPDRCRTGVDCADIAEYRVTRWAEIPSLVTARDAAGGTAKVELPQRFQEAIDDAAMRRGMAGSDAYLEQWRHDEWREADGSPGFAADAELTAASPPAGR